MRSKIEAGHSPRGHFRIDSSLQAQQVHRLNEQCLRGLATVGRDQCFKEIREPGGFVFAHSLTLELASEHSSPAAPKPVAWARIEKSVAPFVGELEKAGVGDLIVHRTGHGLGVGSGGHDHPVDMAFNRRLLLERMVSSVEPGIYEFGWVAFGTTIPLWSARGGTSKLGLI